MRAKVRAAMQRLLPEGGGLICAVSGGADSVALLHCLWTLQEECGFSLRAAHFNHRLRGAASDRDEAFVRRLCQELGIELLLGSGDCAAQAAQSDDSTEEAARRLRYAFFDTLPDPVATAHTAGDNLETLLINLVRGTSLRGLGGIPPKRGRILRPLLDCTRAEVEDYLRAQQLPHVEDETNASEDFLRNRLRRQVVPLLLQENPALLRQVSGMTARLRADEALLTKLARQALEETRTPDGAWNCAQLCAQPEPILSRAAALLLEDIPDRTARHVQALAQLICSERPGAAISLPGSRVARREYALLYLTPAKAAARIPETLLRTPGLTQAGTRRFSCRICSAPEPGALCLPYWPGRPLYVRSRRPGDTLPLAAGRRSVKKLMIDQKLPAHLRDGIPVFCAEDGPVALLWPPGYPPLVHAAQYLIISEEETLD